MLDIKYIRANPEVVKAAVKNKNLVGTVDIDRLLALDEDIRKISTDLGELRSQRNQLDDQIKSSKDQTERAPLIEKATSLKPQVKELEDKLASLKPEFDGVMLWVPNIPASDVPVADSEEGNVVLYEKGQKPVFDFEPKEHLDVAEKLGIIDTKRGAKIAGFRGYFIAGKGMILEQALLRYALDFMVEQGFTPMNVPIMVDKKWLTGTGYFPWGEEDHYYTQDNEGLVGTAEVSLTAYYADEVLEEKDLPTKSGELKYVYTLNNTVAATPRLLAAVIENYQQKDGSIIVPEVLRKYTGFD